MKMRVTWSGIVNVDEKDFHAFEATTPQEVVSNSQEWYNDGTADFVADLSVAANTTVHVELVEE